MSRRKITLIVVAIILLIAAGLIYWQRAKIFSHADVASSSMIQLDKTTYKPGENIAFNFINQTGSKIPFLYVAVFPANVAPSDASGVTGAWLTTNWKSQVWSKQIINSNADGSGGLTNGDHWGKTWDQKNVFTGQQVPEGNYTAIYFVAKVAGLSQVGSAYLQSFSISSFKESRADVKAFGAKGDGVTDDTIAIQTALNVSHNVYIPSGTYIASNLKAVLEGTTISGDGVSSILQFKTGSTGELLSSNGKTVGVSSLNFYGNDDTSKKNISTSKADRSAIGVNSQLNSQISNVTIHGFENYGIKSIDGTRDLLSHLVFTDSTIYNTYNAFLAGPNLAEYIRLANLDIHDNYYGLYISSGNFTATNSKITDNYYGVYLLGTNISNNGHGNVSNSLINHNDYSIYTVDITNGFNFIGNNIFSSNIYLKTSSGINITNGAIDISNYYFEGGGRNYIRDNYIVNASPNTINHNYNSVADNTIMSGNYTSKGTFIDK